MKIINLVIWVNDGFCTKSLVFIFVDLQLLMVEKKNENRYKLRENNEWFIKIG